jgi:asparagine synthetase B (glutamine-hydrolysing)
MTDKKLTDEEIIKALTELSRYTGFQKKYTQVLNATLDLIKRQKSEIERLKSANDEKFRQWNMLAEKTKTHYANLYNEAKDKLKAEAYKEFAERLKQSTVMAVMGNKIYAVATSKGVDNLLKEMVGEEE